jgi:hypothetical protein
LRCLGVEFTRVQWVHRFGMDARTFVRWVEFGRRRLGLTLKFVATPDFRQQVLVLDRRDVEEIDRWVAAIEDFYCFFAQCRRAAPSANEPEGMADARSDEAA